MLKNKIKSPEELKNIRQSGVILTAVLDVLVASAKAGVTSLELDAIAVRIVEVERFAHAVIRRARERNARGRESPQRLRERRARRIHERHVIQARRARRRRRTTLALPRVQPDVVVIPARREKDRVAPVSLRDLEPEHVAVEAQRPLEVGNTEMDVPDADARVERLWCRRVRWSRHGFVV